MARTERHSKPYSRPRADPDGPGSWKHDLHQSSSSSLADRLSSGAGNGNGAGAGSSSRPSLLSRISGGQGKELLPSGSGRNKLFGFGSQPPTNGNNANAGLELLPSGPGTAAATGPMRNGKTTPRGFQAQPGQRSLVQSGVNAALGLGLDERSRRERRSRELIRDHGGQAVPVSARQSGGGVSILGAGKTTTMVRVANLAYGTTAEDVVSAFAPLPVLEATVSSAPPANLVSVDLELHTAADAQELINKYDGQIADGNKLSVTIVRQSLKERMGGGPVGRQDITARNGNGRGQELLDTSNSGKMYSDTILQSNPNAYIQTLAEERAEAERNRQRADAWARNGGERSQRLGRQSGGGNGSLAARLGGGRGGNYKGRGQAGGGMMVD